MDLTASDLAFILNDAHLAWVQGADDTRRFPDFGTYAVHRLGLNGMEIKP